MNSRLMKVLLLIVAIVALETTAHAQPRAEDLYAEGQAAYDSADYTMAIAKWQAAYDLSKERDLLFNIAQAQRLSGACLEAIATYRHFVTADPDPASAQHKLAKDLVLELEMRCPAGAPVVLPALDKPSLVVRLSDREADLIRSGRTWKIAGLVTSGVGVAAIAIGLGLGHHGASIGDEITSACLVSCDWATLKDRDARGKREVAIGKALDVAGVATIAGGVIFYYLGVRQETFTVARPSGGNGGVISWSGAW